MREQQEEAEIKKDTGAVQALYPTPATVVGTVFDGKVNWLLVAHVGIVGMDGILVSMRTRGTGPMRA